MTSPPDSISAATLPAADRPVSPPPWTPYADAFARWALWAAIAVGFLMGMEINLGFGRLLSGLAMGFLLFALLSLGDGLFSLLWALLRFALRRLGRTTALRRLEAISPTTVGRIAALIFLIGADLLAGDTFLRQLVVPPVGEIAILLVAGTGVLVTAARRHGDAPLTGGIRRRHLFLGGALLLNLTYLVWVAQPGSARHLTPLPAGTPAPLTTVADPGASGPYAVRTLTYGSGGDRHREEYGTEADLLTRPVDGSRIFAGYASPAANYLRWYLGHDFLELPLNGLVWYPEGEGPFPLVLIVHGNHLMTEPSDPGYAYLGEHLASRGMIAVSVDQNALNGLLFIDAGMKEIPLRAWLLLKHLQQWREWNETPENPFYRQVDLERVALIGHSRGGEAVAVASEMNWRPRPPVSAVSNAAEFGFGIRGVVALAPSDGNYQRFLALTHSDYLLLGGGHDADTFTLYGQAQYNRVSFDDNPDGFKALVYLYQGNHGQFNTVWANRDRGWLNSLLLNRRPLLSGEAQRQATQVFVTAFLEASLRGEEAYRALFANPAAGNGWLPESIFVTQYEDASFVAVDTNRPNSAAERVDLPAGGAAARDVSQWETRALLLRDGATAQQNHALYVAWEAGGEPEVALELGRGVDVPAGSALTFALTTAADVDVVPAVTVELEDAGGHSARVPLSQVGPIYPPLPARLTKAEWLRSMPGYDIALESPYERVLQTYTIPLANFTAANQAFEPHQIEVIRFLFDGAASGALYLDQVGFVEAK